MKKILITGGNGFLGANLISLLIKKNYKIYATKRNKSNLARLKPFIKKIIFLNINNLDKYFNKNNLILI